MKWFAVYSILLLSGCGLLKAQITDPSLILNGSFGEGSFVGGLVNEGDTLQACVEYTTLPSSETVIVVSTLDGGEGGAQGGVNSQGDFDQIVENLVFGPGSATRQCADIQVYQDSVLEDVQIFQVVATLSGDNIMDSPGDASIMSSDTITIGFGATEYSVNENESDRMACVVIEQGGIESTVGVQVTLTSTDGTATEADNDYNSAVFNTLILTLDGNTGDGGVCFTIPVTDDDTLEQDESYTITLNSISQVVFDEATRTTTVVIVNDDAECPSPPDLTNGEFTLSSDAPSVLGDTAMYSCNSGYLLDGVDTLTCEFGDVWAPAAPGTCLRDCGGLNAPTNGAVDHPQTTAGSTATYTCMSGYTIDTGDATRTCQADGTWSGTEATCRQLNTCPELPLIENGTVSPRQGIEGDVATYSCDSGYTLNGNEQRMCEQQGWSGSEPSCEEIQMCPELPLIENGNVSPRQGTEGDVATYSCDSGYTLNGNEQRMCEQQGWSGSEPSCEEIQPPVTGGQQSLTQDQMIGIGVGVGLAVLVILILVIVAIVVIILVTRRRREDKYVLNYSTVYGNQNKPEMTSKPVEPEVYEERSVDAAEEPAILNPESAPEAETQA